MTVRGQTMVGMALALGMPILSSAEVPAYVYTGNGYLPRAYSQSYDLVRARRYYRQRYYRAGRGGWRYRAFGAPLH